MMLLKVFYFCLILISSPTLADIRQEKIRYNNTFQNGVDCFSGPLFWTTCRYERYRDINAGPAPFPMVRPNRIFFTICILTNLSQVTLDIVEPICLL